MATNPKHTVGDVVYLLESAAIGSLEAVKIGGVHLGQGGWMYTINVGIGQIGHLDRRSSIGNQVLYYTEDEFLLFHDALVLVEANAKAAYEKAKAQRQMHYPDNPTES